MSITLSGRYTEFRSSDFLILLPDGSKEHEVLQTGSLHREILPSGRFVYNRAF